MTPAPIEPLAFHDAFARFQDLVKAKSGHPFRGFDEGVAAVWESYKPRLWDHALALLDAGEWIQDQIGSGAILDRAIAAIEIQDNQLNLNNNLVFWQNRFGHANRDHRMFLEAAMDPGLRSEIEGLLFDLYRSDADEGTAFDRMSEVSGGKYPLLAYMFFLKNMDEFMPIQPTGFDRAFRALRIDFTTLRQCSWENYTTYNATLEALRPLIANAAKLKAVRLVDAHSFCWIFSSLMKQEAEGTLTDGAGKSGAGRVVGGRDRAIIELRTSIENTVRQSRGQTIERWVKDKQTTLSSAELDELIGSLLTIQGDRCALTGIRFQYHGTDSDRNLLPSPDRIDSDGHYVPGNIQIVCRFVNFWKGAIDNDEFKELLMLVRGEEVSE